MEVGFIKDNAPILYLTLFCLLLGVSIPSLVDKLENPMNIFTLLIFPVALYVLIKYPEIPFALFVNAGIYKADTRLHLPEFLDLTVLFGIIAIIGIAIGISRKQIKFFYLPKKLLLPYLVIAILSVISLTYTLAPIYGTLKLLKFLTITSFAMFGPLFLFQNEHSIKRFFITYVFIEIIIVFDVIFSGNLHTYKSGFTEAFGSSGYLGLGMFSGEVFLILSFYFFLNIKTKALKLFIIGLLVSSLFLTLVSGARGSILALAIVFVMIFLCLLVRFLKGELSLHSRGNVSRRNRKILFGFIIILCIVGFTTSYFHEYFSMLQARIDITLSGESDPVRTYQYHKASEVLLSFPSVVTGLGIGGFSMFAHGYDRKRGAFVHNIFLDIGAELGVVGLISFSLLIYWGFATAFRTLKKTKDAQYFIGITLILLSLFMLVYASVHGNINNCRSLLLWIGLIYAHRSLVYRRRIV